MQHALQEYHTCQLSCYQNPPQTQCLCSENMEKALPCIMLLYGLTLRKFPQSFKSLNREDCEKIRENLVNSGLHSFHSNSSFSLRLIEYVHITIVTLHVFSNETWYCREMARQWCNTTATTSSSQTANSSFEDPGIYISICLELKLNFLLRKHSMICESDNSSHEQTQTVPKTRRKSHRLWAGVFIDWLLDTQYGMMNRSVYVQFLPVEEGMKRAWSFWLTFYLQHMPSPFSLIEALDAGRKAWAQTHQNWTAEAWKKLNYLQLSSLDETVPMITVDSCSWQTGVEPDSVLPFQAICLKVQCV